MVWDSCSCESGIPFALCDTAVAITVINSFHCFCFQNTKSNKSCFCVLEGAPPYTLYSLIFYLGNGQLDLLEAMFHKICDKNWQTHDWSNWHYSHWAKIYSDRPFRGVTLLTGDTNLKSLSCSVTVGDQWLHVLQLTLLCIAWVW
jgi:hypothetical protein